MALPPDIRRLEREYRVGKDPRGYLPFCRELRRRRRFLQALDVCRRSLPGDPNPAEGGLLLARLLMELGRYVDALGVVERLAGRGEAALAVRLVKLECLVRLRYLAEAEVLYEELAEEAPLEAEVQHLGKKIGALRRQMAREGGNHRAPAGGDGVRPLPVTRKEILEGILAEVGSLVRVKSCAVVPLGGGEPALEGKAEHALAGYEVHREVNTACGDLDFGEMRWGIMETPKAQLIVLVRGKNLVSLSIDPTQQLGKILHRLVLTVRRLIPEETAPPLDAKPTGANP